MSSLHYLEFDAADNPMYLKKVGNWVFTFLTAQAELSTIQLAMTSVLPRQVSEKLQPIRIIIEQTEIENRWLIQQVECYDSEQGKDERLSCNNEIGIKVIQSIIQEFKKYDVDIDLL